MGDGLVFFCCWLLVFLVVFRCLARRPLALNSGRRTPPPTGRPLQVWAGQQSLPSYQAGMLTITTLWQILNKTQRCNKRSSDFWKKPWIIFFAEEILIKFCENEQTCSLVSLNSFFLSFFSLEFSFGLPFNWRMVTTQRSLEQSGIEIRKTLYSGVLLKWEFFIKMRAACFAPSFLQKRGVLEWGWLQVGSSHFTEKFSL